MSDITNERLIISALLQRNAFREKVHHYIFPDYFSDAGEKAVVVTIQNFVAKYQNFPTESDLIVALKNDNTITEDITDDAVDVVKDVFDIQPSKNTEYLIDVAREFCKDKAIYNAIQKTIEVYKGEAKASIGIPEMLQNALSVDFDETIGHDYFEQAAARYDYYQSPVTKIPFDIEIWNKVTNGGVERKTLNALAAGINVGKTMTLVSLAAMYIRMGLNVFYASNEMSDMKISNRVDANILNVPINSVRDIEREVFMTKIGKMKAKGYGRLFVKDYATGTGHAGLFQKDIRDIQTKQKVKIDVMIVDYVQIVTPMTPAMRAEKSYAKYKAVTEELRAVCVTEDLIGWTALQFNRGGLDNSDPGMGDVGESTGIPATLDGMWAVIRTEELDGIGQLLISEIKSRYGDKSIPKFTVGVNINTQRLYDVHEDEQKKFVTNSPAKRFERDAEEVERRNEKAVASAKGRFTGFKVTNDD